MSVTLGGLFNHLQGISVLSLLLFVAMTVSIILLVVVQTRKDQVDLRWLMLDDVTERPSLHKIGQLFALMVSTWGFIVLVDRDKLTETYFATYMGIWAGTTALSKYLDNSAQAIAGKSGASTTTTTTATTATTEKTGPSQE